MATEKPTRARRHEPWPVAIAALLAAMIGTGTAFCGIAQRNPDALVVDDAFQAGLRYDDAARAADRARARGWQLDVRSDVEADGTYVVATLRDAAGASLAAERMTLRRERPTEGGYDADFDLQRSGADFAGQVALPRPGRWQLVVRAEQDGDVIERRLPVWMP